MIVCETVEEARLAVNVMSPRPSVHDMLIVTPSNPDRFRGVTPEGFEVYVMRRVYANADMDWIRDELKYRGFETQTI